MATKITVTVEGPLGLDEPDLLLTELEKATGLPWRAQETGEGNFLGVPEIVLTAILGGAIGKATEMSLGAAIDSVKGLIRRWRDERLDPPEITVSEEPVSDVQAPDVSASDGSAG